MTAHLPFSHAVFDEMHRLVATILGGNMSSEQGRRLEKLIRQDIGVCDLYLDLLFESSMLLDWAEGNDSANNDAIEKTANPAPLGILSSAYHGTIGFFSQELPFSLLIATLLTGFGLWIASLVYVSSPEKIAQDSSPPVQSSFDPTLKVVGKITGMVDCKWANPNTETFHGTNVLLGRKYALASGLMEITYDTGAKVILQGPVSYEVESKNGGFMSVGKLTGKVENEAARGFSVRTPTATVTDLGTEFGVEVSKAGDTTSHVFRGSVRLEVTSTDGKAKGIVQVLHENESACVEKDSGKQAGSNPVTVSVTPAKPISFIREIPKQTIRTFDLVDVVAGGDGFSGRRNAGIDVLTGQRRNAYKSFTAVGDEKYHRVAELPFVDGVFVPDGNHGPVQVDSAGHTFNDLGKTSNQFAAYIWAGGDIPSTMAKIPTTMTRVDYSQKDHGLLFLHTNKGITFDLEAVRRANPGWQPVRFNAMSGSLGPGMADVWLVVDGCERFSRHVISKNFANMPVAVPLHKKDRFLTLMATDGGDGISADWVLFGDPRLELARDKTKSSEDRTK